MATVRNFEVMFENNHNYEYYTTNTTTDVYCNNSRSRWPRGLRRGSAVVRLLGSRVRIPLTAMDVCPF
jgi:hypothetical protein